MMVSKPVSGQLLRPSRPDRTRILFIARHAPEAPAYTPKTYPGCGGYPQYYHRVWETLSGLGYAVHTATHVTAVLTAGGRADLVFSLYNRMPLDHPEVLAASLCDYVGIPCVGAPPNIRAVAEDKWLTKLAAGAAGLPVAPGAVYADEDSLSRLPDFPGPYFVKNRFGAASEGVEPDCVQDDWAGAARTARRFFARGMTVLVEAFAPGIDVTVPVLGGSGRPIVLGLVHSRSDQSASIITEDLKRDDPLGYALFDAGEHAAAFHRDADTLWRAMGPMDYLRLDFRFDPATGRRVFLEFNLCCHIGRSGAVCLAAAEHGLTQADVLAHVVEFSLRRQAGRAAARPWLP